MSTLESKAKQIQQAMGDARRGPLLVASIVVEIADNWEQYKEEAGGVRVEQWLRDCFGPGRGLSWFRARHEAVAALEGPEARGDVRRCWDHEAAVWVYRNVPATKLREVKMRVLEEYSRQRHPVPLALCRVQAIAAGVIGKKPRAPRVCKQCAEHEAEIERLRALLAARPVVIETAETDVGNEPRVRVDTASDADADDAPEPTTRTRYAHIEEDPDYDPAELEESLPSIFGGPPRRRLSV